MAMTQQIVRFSGYVQGVGFRYTTCRLAGGFDVTGYVRNLSDGRVECVVEGERAEVEAFLDAVGEHMGDLVRGLTRTEAPHSGAYTSFGVRY